MNIIIIILKHVFLKAFNSISGDVDNCLKHEISRLNLWIKMWQTEEGREILRLVLQSVLTVREKDKWVKVYVSLILQKQALVSGLTIDSPSPRLWIMHEHWGNTRAVWKIRIKTITSPEHKYCHSFSHRFHEACTSV